MRNIELFEEYATKILARLYKSFPVPEIIDVLSLSGFAEVDEYGRMSKEAEICKATIKWLSDEGFLKYEEELSYGFRGVVLTRKGLEVLRKVPEGLREKESLGEKVVKALGKGAVETAISLVRELLLKGLG